MECEQETPMSTGADNNRNIREVARAAGVSVATVSRVINGSKQVSEKTRLLVEEARAKVGYVPNSAAKALTTRRSRIIGAIIPTLSHSIFATFLGELEAMFSKLNYSVIIALSNGDPKQEEKRAFELLSMGAEAFILVGAERQSSLLDLLTKRNIPSLRTSFWNPEDGIPTIGYDNQTLAESALVFLMKQGHRNIGVLHGPAQTNDRTRGRLDGIATIANKHSDLKVALFEGSLDAAGGVQATQNALMHDSKPTALLCLSDVLALGALFEAPRQGFSVPDDVSIMGFDDLAWSAFTHPRLTTMALPTLEMGRLAAKQLAALLDNGAPLQSVCLPAEIVERDSVRCMNAPSLETSQ